MAKKVFFTRLTKMFLCGSHYLCAARVYKKVKGEGSSEVLFHFDKEISKGCLHMELLLPTERLCFR